jgi:hypothetical protein
LSFSGIKIYQMNHVWIFTQGGYKATGDSTVSRPSLAVALVVMGVAEAFIMTTATSSLAAPIQDGCDRDYTRCMDSCDRLPPGGDGSRRAICIGRCGLMLMNCYGGEAGAKEKGNKAPPTDSTKLPPKGQELREPIGVSGDKQLGGGKPSKSKIGLDKVNVGGIKPLGTTGASTQPIGKVKVNTGVRGVKRLNQGWNSQSTSGGTIMMQRSRGGKKHQ